MTTLNLANRIYIGANQASAVYVGANKVWPLFKPTDLSGCAIWIDASSLGLANGAAVSPWANLGSAPNPTIAGSPAPVLRTNALNTIMPVVRITQGQGRYRFASTGIDKNWTLVYVGRKWRATRGRVIAANGSGGGGNILVGFHYAEWDQCYVDGWLTPTNTVQSTAWKLYSADSTSAAVARFFSNGNLLYNGSVTPSQGFGGTLAISGYLDGEDIGASQQSDCEIAELVMYNRKLSDAERGQVETYLRYKWNAPTTMFKPTDLGSSLIAWFDGSDLASIVLAGAGVGSWTNRGVGGMTLTQTTDTYRPTSVDGAVNIAMGQIFAPANAPATYDLIIASKPNGIADWRTLMRSAQGHEMIIESGSTRFGIYHATAAFNQAGGYTWDNVDGIGFTRVAADAITMMSRDGGPLASAGPALTSASAATTMFGGYGLTGPSQGWGKINEVIIVPYNSEELRPKLEGYLAHRWGLTGLLPASHPYKVLSP